MSRKEVLMDDVFKSREINILKSMKGWQFIEEFITVEEGKLTKKILDAPRDEIEQIRGGLKLLRSFKVFLDMASLSGREAAVELEKYMSKV